MIRDELIHTGSTVAVMGLGVTGAAALRYCLACGARVLVSDSRSPERLNEECGDLLAQPGVRWEAGGHTFEFLRQADVVIVSPGVPQNHTVLASLAASGVPVVGELAVAAPHLRMPVVAVTGTNGKTTVTSLIGEIVREAGRKVFVGGNIGTPVFDYLLAGERAEVLVLEVSSFQLLHAGRFAPAVGVLLNITPDHIDRHGSMAEYAAAKMALFAHQRPEQSAIVCGDDPECMQRVDEIVARRRTFGLAAGNTARIDGSVVRVAEEGQTDVYDLAGTPLGNAIGAGNAAAAILACRDLGIAPEVIRAALKQFRPGPHRIQPVGELRGVRFVDDSKATNTGAVIAALQQLEGKAVLIAGGRDKGEDYSLLREMVAEKARAVIVIGEAAGKIGAALEGCAELLPATSLEEAVWLGYGRAREGDTVLLSPACASFDMFRSYAHRGEVFAEAVRRLVDEEQERSGGGR